MRVEEVQTKPEKSVKGIAVLLSNATLANHVQEILVRLEYHVCRGQIDGDINHVYLVDTKSLPRVPWPSPRVLFVSSLSPAVIELSVRTQCLGIIVPSQGVLELKATFDIALMVAKNQCALETANSRLLRKLRERKTIEMAKEMLKKRYLIDEERAYHMIRREAMNSRRTLGEVAEEFLLKHE
ncbi:MAG: ANTAR domain-containing response regulator [Sulfobacillus sp.]